MDSDGYGGHCLYLDNYSAGVTVQNNLVYRCSDAALNITYGPSPGLPPHVLKNNIFGFSRRSLFYGGNPWKSTGCPASPSVRVILTSNIFYFDRKESSSPAFGLIMGCPYACGFQPYSTYQAYQNNLYWRADGQFASDSHQFRVQTQPAAAGVPCNSALATYTYMPFANWQTSVDVGGGTYAMDEDTGGAIGDPGFKAPFYPQDDYSFPQGSPGHGFIPFDPTQAGRNGHPPLWTSVPDTVGTLTYNPATDF
jgi:hypothetical protein